MTWKEKLNQFLSRPSSELYVIEDWGYKTPCWIWKLALSHTGYGHISIRIGQNTKSYRAHRVIYESINGEIPEGRVPDHLCKIKRCVNPEHIEIVSHAENTRRSPVSKLSKEQAEQIRELYSTNQYSEYDLAKKFSVNQSTVHRVISNQIWFGN